VIHRFDTDGSPFSAPSLPRFLALRPGIFASNPNYVGAQRLIGPWGPPAGTIGLATHPAPRQTPTDPGTWVGNSPLNDREWVHDS